MKIYYVENFTNSEIEQFYLIDPQMGLLYEVDLDGNNGPHYDSMKDFKSTWKDNGFDKYAVMVRIL